MKNEGFRPPKSGLLPLKMKVMGSHGSNLPGSFGSSTTVDITLEPHINRGMRWRFIDCLWLSQVFTGGTNPGVVESNIGAGSFKGF